MYLGDYTAPPRKLKVGGGQNEGDAAAATASCLLRVMEIFLFSLSDRGAFATREAPPANWVDWFPWDIGCSMSGSVQHARYFTILLVPPLFFSVNCDLK